MLRSGVGMLEAWWLVAICTQVKHARFPIFGNFYLYVPEFLYICIRLKLHFDMKKEVKNLIQDAKNVLDTNDKVSAPKVLQKLVDALQEEPDPNKKWWVIVLKVLAYLIGLLLAGVGTANAATLLIH